MRFRYLLAVLAAATFGPSANADVMLGPFDFNSSQFGNTLTESDGGAYRNGNWLNVVNANPGNPGALTGPNFNTGIANIGLLSGVPIDYTIGYNTPIVNGPGPSLGFVTGYSVRTDVFHIAVSTDGTNFTPFQNFPGTLAVDTGVSMSYFYGGSGPFATNLFVIPIDLSASFGLPLGASVVAVRLEGQPGEEPDAFRFAGFASPVPEPASLTLLGIGAAGLLGYGRLRRKPAAG
jgi:hypothetical protein